MNHLLSNFLIWQNIEGQGNKKENVTRPRRTDLYEALEWMFCLAGSPSWKTPRNPYWIWLWQWSRTVWRGLHCECSLGVPCPPPTCTPLILHLYRGGTVRTAVGYSTGYQLPSLPKMTAPWWSLCTTCRCLKALRSIHRQDKSRDMEDQSRGTPEPVLNEAWICLNAGEWTVDLFLQ